MKKVLGATLLLPLLLGVGGPALAQKSKDKARGGNKILDSGSFGVFVAGKRVATETFQVEETPSKSIATAEFKTVDGSGAAQTSQLELAPNGNLLRYEWKELSPGKASAVVGIKDQFLVEHIVTAPNEKPTELPFILPASTLIVDDNFFLHRQILAWHYLATSCTPAPERPGQCRLTRTQFGIFIPQQHRPVMVSLEYMGKEKLPIAGVERELDRVKLEAEGVEWSLWLDSQYRLIRVLVAGQNVEILRD
ncbi:MAG TPA: hypothetical protein VNK82_08545 [Terriglobales bacterium]|nr:hypothetical protein [Terriglobales bacterium]